MPLDLIGWRALPAALLAGGIAMGDFPVLPIPVGSSAGTVDSHKAEAFDAQFRPPPYGRGRWSEMYHAVQTGAALPPISVYRFEGRHCVRDGHHRVSVARALEQTDIDADVTQLVSASR